MERVNQTRGLSDRLINAKLYSDLGLRYRWPNELGHLFYVDLGVTQGSSISTSSNQDLLALFFKYSVRRLLVGYRVCARYLWREELLYQCRLPGLQQ